MNPTRKVITFGEVLLRFSASGFERFTQASQYKAVYAGSEANVAASLSLMGIPAQHVTRLPENDFGKAATQTLNRFGVDTSRIIYGKERMGVFFFENGAMQRSPRIIYDRFDSAFSNVQSGQVDWDKVMEDASWFHWSGITPAISQGAADVCLEAITAARKNNVTVSGDINYRRNLWQFGKTPQQVMPQLINMTSIIVGGPTDIENCLGITAETLKDVFEKTLWTHPNVQMIATSVRESFSASHNRISGILFDGKNLYQSRQYDLTHIVDRVGAGDAFMAGLIYSTLKKKKGIQTIEFATAAGALKHSIEGDVNLSTVNEIQGLADGENSGKLLR